MAREITRSRISGTGMCVPDRIVTNEELTKLMDTTDEWIQQRTGIRERRWIEDGQIGAPVKGATLIGNGPDVMQRISRIGHDLELDPGVGVCGKDGQGVPVGVGMPTIRIDGITVGGTEG